VRIPSPVAKAAIDVSQLNQILGTDSAESVLLAAMTRNRREVLAQVADMAEAAAASEDVAGLDPGIVLEWFAAYLREMLPDEDQPGAYAPSDGDYVEVHLTGVISEYEITGDGVPTFTAWDITTDNGLSIPLESHDFHQARVQVLLPGVD